VEERDWELLLARIADGLCTPFLGAGATAHALPLASDIAREWAARHRYPLDDSDDLARVAQFLAVRHDPMFPKDLIGSALGGLPPPDFDAPDEPHAALARLPLRIFMTTNYDGSMASALRAAGKHPRTEICRWNDSPALADVPSPLEDDGYVPSPAAPLVYHLHGQLGQPESLVLTEDDYLDFLVALSREPGLLPHPIQRALANTSLLFIGYRLADWNFRVLHRGLVAALAASLRRVSVTVQLHTGEAERDYLSSYFDALNLRVYWGTAEEFVTELRTRMDARA
jgi:SIR2-like domain